MADCMTFPDDPFDFIDEYSFEDKDHVYTNGSKLISAFRVKQALEHYFAKPSGHPLDEEYAERLWTSAGMYRHDGDTAHNKLLLELNKNLHALVQILAEANGYAQAKNEEARNYVGKTE